MSDKRFVKSADTSVPKDRSRAEVEKMLRRYGASGLSVAEDYDAGRIILTFVIPDSLAKDAAKIPVKLPVSVRHVYDAMYGRPVSRKWDVDQAKYIEKFNPSGYDAKQLQQAERVAWRHLVLWIDAALSAATAGLQTITEAFFAHAVVGAGGERMVELVEQAQQQLGPGVQRLLMAPADDA